MTYSPTNWKVGPAGGTLVTAARLNNIEKGLVDGDVTNPESAAAAALSATYATLPTGTRNALTGWFHADGFGAKGDGVADSRPAIQAAIDAANAAGGGVVYLPAGVYLLGRGGASWNLLLKSNVAIRGAARDDVTLVQSAGAVTSERIFSTGGVATSNVVISSLTIDGNKANQTVNEHRHAVFLQNASQVIVRDVEIYGMSGGGVSLYTACSDITVENSYIHDVDRGCVEATGGDTYRVAIRNNRLTIPAASGAQPIDLEVENTGNGHAEDVTITNNIVTTTMPGGYAISCASVANYNQRVIISGNTLTGGINCYGSQGTSIVNNTITSIGGDRAILANAKVIDLLISGNQITTTAGTVYAIESGLSLGAQPNGVCITGNQINAVTGGIKLTGTKTVIITGNTIRAAGTASAVWVQATANMESTVITGNTLINTGPTAIDIQTYSTNTFKSLVVTNNAVVDDQATVTVLRGVRLAGAAAQFLNTSVQGNTVTASIATNFLDSTTGGPVAGKVNFSAATVGTVAPAAGAAGALPATPTGYLTVTIGNTERKVAYY